MDHQLDVTHDKNLLIMRPSKAGVLFLVLVLNLHITASLSDREIIQLTLKGLFIENGLAQPDSITTCIDLEDGRGPKIVEFTGKTLDKAANGSFQDFIQL